jgi:parvulin-like peptidyl-prolyl isomerase
MSSISKQTFFTFALALATCLGAQAQTSKPAAPAKAQPHASKPAAPANSQAQPKPQAQPKAQGNPTTEAAKTAKELPPSTPVITLQGLCPKGATTAPGAECKTVITKAEFERLANALNPDMTDQVRRQLATTYAQVLLLARSAEKQGLADTPQAKELLQFARLQGLAQVLVRKTQQEAEQIPPDEVQKYYQDHHANFEQATMRRLFIPKFKVEQQGDKPVPLDKATVDATAQKIKAGAAAGEPFEKLQKDAYDQLGIKTDPPSTEAVTITREQMPDMHEAAFDLKPGEVSQLFDQPGGIYIYKVEAKKTQPLEEVKPQIQQTMAESRMQTKMVEATGGASPKLNDDYFGEAPPEAPQAPPQQ